MESPNETTQNAAELTETAVEPNGTENLQGAAETGTVPQNPDAAEQSAASAENAEQAGSFFGDLMDLLESVLVSVFVVMLMLTYLICTADVDGTSMLPTLTDKDRLLVTRIDKEYERGDILILDVENANLLDDEGHVVTRDAGFQKRIVKRLIATAGQEVNIDFAEGIVYVDGQALDEPYTSSLTTRDEYAFTYPITVPEGYVFVLGDNRHVSNDSRSDEVGLIPESGIVGKVLLRISPLRSFGTVK
jgi:signal peptidase I